MSSSTSSHEVRNPLTSEERTNTTADVELTNESFRGGGGGGGGGGEEEEEAASRLDSPTMQADVLLMLPVDSPAGVQ